MKAFHSVLDCTSGTLRRSGLGASDFRVLEALLHKGPLPVNTIGPKVFLTPGSISIAINRLHEKGLVVRVDSRTDRRVRVVELTPAGRTLIQTVFEIHARELEEIAEVLTQSERAVLVSLLKKFGKRGTVCQDSQIPQADH